MDQATDEFIHTLYDAVLDADKWPHVAAKMAALAEAPHASLMDVDFAAGVVYQEALHGMTAGDNQEYLQSFASIDPRVPIVLGNNKQAWMSDYDFFNEEFRKNDRFYQGYMQPRQAGENLLLAFAKEGSRLGAATIVRNVSQEKLNRALRLTLDGVTPHMDRAIKLSRRFAAVAMEAILGHNVLDALNEPLACATSDGRLHRANIAFEESLRAGRVLSLKQGVLQIGYPEINTQFLRSVRECCRIAEGGSSGDPDAQFTLRIDQLSGPPTFVTIAPLMAVHFKSWAGKPCALIRIDEPEREPEQQLLVEALGLSVAEARLVSALCAGGALSDAAERIGISVNTAKSHLASAFSKTGTSRQSELVALATALPRRR